MIWRHPAHADRRIRLAYCQNLHPGDDLEATLTAMRAITLPLRARLAGDARFGVGLYLNNRLARQLSSRAGESELLRLARFLETNALDAFTYNAFPYERFHEPGLKADVFKPTWKDPERLEFTLAVARAGVAILCRSREVAASDHLSISTHTGMFAAWIKSPRDLDECAANLARAVDELARIEEESGVRVVLALEPEPRANAGDTLELMTFVERVMTVALSVLEEERNRDSARAAALLKRHLGACLDCCHAAVEFESDPVRTLQGLLLGKIQYSNAVCVESPGRNAAGVEALLALDEPRYLHQVTASSGAQTLRVNDLSELRAALATEGRAAWLAANEWRAHVHVPVDLESAGAGLTTTRAFADRVLERLLADPESWSAPELHVEIETYTWSILPDAVRGEGTLVDGLEREYAHVIGVLERAGWTRGG